MRAAGASAQLTLIIATPDVLVAVRHGVEKDAPALHSRTRAGGTVVASEPMDDTPDWQELAPERILIVRRTGASVERL